jgi:hypothetical protein
MTTDDDVREEAAELREAEEARVRLVDRLGDATVHLIDGSVRRGRLDSGRERIADHLVLRISGADPVLVPVRAVVWVSGSSSMARDENAGRERSVASVLREWRAVGLTVCVDLPGHRVEGRIVGVGADHLTTDGADRMTRSIPYAAILALTSRPG